MDVLGEVYVEEVQVKRGLHKPGGDGDGVDHVLRKVSSRHMLSVRAYDLAR